MSNLVGWLVLYNGAPEAPSTTPGTGARLYSSAAFPALDQIEAIAPDHLISHVRFSPNGGGWAIVCADGTVVYSEQGGGPRFPSDAEAVIAAGIGPNTFLDILFTPTGDWVAKFRKPDGSRHYEQSDNFPNELLDIIQSKDPESGPGSELLCLVFPPPNPLPSPAPTGPETTVWNTCILIFDNNLFVPYTNTLGGGPPTPPEDIWNQLNASHNFFAEKVQSAFYTSTSGWGIITSANALYTNDNFDPWLAQQILSANTYLHDNGYTLPIMDVAIEVPVRNVSFQITSILANKIRSAGLSKGDTVYCEAAITLDTNPPQTSTVYFGNEVRNGTVLGLGGTLFAGSDSSGLVGTGPVGAIQIVPQYAVSTPTIQIVDPRSSVAFSYIVVNNGASGPLSTTPLVDQLGNAAVNLISKAVDALLGFLGIPAAGAITGPLITGLGTNAFPSSGCDGLCAMDTYYMSGAGVMALDYNNTAGVIFQDKTREYNNRIYSDSFLGGQSPYDPNPQNIVGIPLCQVSDYFVTSAIIEQDTEVAVTYGQPTASGTAQVIVASPAWPQGQAKGADTTPQALAACVFLTPQQINRTFVFWTANDPNHGIWLSSSVDGVNWTRGALANPPGPVGSSTSVGTTTLPLAACTYEGDLPLMIYIFWIPTDGSNVIQFAVSADGISWWSGLANPSNKSPQPPAACVFNGKLFLYWTANDNSHVLYGSSYAGGTGEDGMPTPPTESLHLGPRGRNSSQSSGPSPPLERQLHPQQPACSMAKYTCSG